MGWLFMRDLGGHSTPRAYLDNQFTYTRDDHRLTVLASSIVGSTYYAAAERVDGSGERQIFAIVCLIKTSTGARDGCTFGYKDMTEHMGPCESECPASILNELTDTDSEYAQAWRARCKANLVQRRLRNAKPTPKPGQTIVFGEPCASATARSAPVSRWCRTPRGARRSSGIRRRGRSAVSQHSRSGPTTSSTR